MAFCDRRFAHCVVFACVISAASAICAIDASAQVAGAAGGASGPPAVGAKALLKVRLAQMSAAADFNQDGLADVAAVDFLKDSVRLLIREPAGGFRAERVPVGSGPRAIAAID